MDSIATQSSADLARQVLTLQAASTHNALQIEMLRQQSQGDQAVVALLEGAASASPAALPPGQGGSVDVTV